MTVRVTLVDPFDEQSRARLAQALWAAGARVARIFMAPVDPDAIGSYLSTEGLEDRLVVPVRDAERDVDHLAELAHAGGIPRRIVAAVSGSPESTRRRLAERLPGEALGQVLVARLEEVLSPEFQPELARHLAPQTGVGFIAHL
jgi:hypothetical protein